MKIHFFNNDSRENVLPEFLDTPGLNPGLNLPDQTTDRDLAIFFINTFLSGNLFESITLWTNKRAAKYISKFCKKIPVQVANWVDTNADKIKKFLV